MFRLLSPVTLGREADLRLHPVRARRRVATRRRDRHPSLESLETRITPSTMTWTGATNGDWMTAGNWSSDKAPQAGDDLVFPANSSNLNVVNDFPANTAFNSITIQAQNYSLTGNPVTVTTKLAATYSSGSSSDAINTDVVSGTVGVSTGGILNLVGAISGSAGLNVSGGGTLDLSGTNTYTGTTIAAGATILVDSSAGAVQASSGVIGGNGTVGNLTSVGGTVSPGHPEIPNVLQAGSLTLDANSTFVTELDGTSPGNGVGGYDQLVASGPVVLGGATLNATLGSDYTPKVGDQLTIISNTSGALSGTFAGLAEGSTDVISGYSFRISYQGGSGHDVVLTALPFPTTTTISASTQASTYGQSVTFTAVVSGSHGQVAGQVAFFDGNPSSGGTQLGIINVASGGQSVFATTKLDVAGSPHQIYAVYKPSSSSSYGGSTTTQPVSVTIAPATITASLTGTVSKTYDGTTSATVASGNIQISGVVNGDVVTATASSATYDTKDVGSGKTVTAIGVSLSGTGAGNYVLSSITATGPVGTINALGLTVGGITAQNKVYDGTTSATINTSGAMLTGVISGDAVSLVTTGAVGAFASKDVGIGKPIIVTGLSLSGADASDYSIANLPSAVTANLTPAPLTVKANPATMIYGGTIPALTETANGLVGPDTVASALSGSLATVSASSQVGTYPITQGTLAAVNGDYTITFDGANLTITPAPLKIAVNDASRVYGAPNPTFTVTYSGFVNDDSAAGLSTAPSLSTSATATSPVGIYSISAAGASSKDYTITYVPGTLTIAKASTSAILSEAIGTTVVGQSATFGVQVAPVSPGAGSATGTVTFLVDGTPVAAEPVNSATGVATFSSTTLGLGTHTITADYSGDTNFTSSQSGSTQETVSAAATQSILTLQAVRNKRGKIIGVDLLSQILVVSPGAGVPTGVVTYFRKGRPLYSVTLTGARATAKFTLNQALKKSFAIRYSGDSQFTASISSSVVPTTKSLKFSARTLTSFLGGR